MLKLPNPCTDIEAIEVDRTLLLERWGIHLSIRANLAEFLRVKVGQ